MTKNRRFVCLPIAIVASALSASVAFADDAPEKKGECPVDQFTMALRYQQQSAEVRALQMQAYNIATEKLDAAVAAAEDPSKLAIVSDVDETIIDNSALLARDLANCHTYDGWDTWLPWERDGNPVLIPGAKKFLEHADKLGVAIRYVSDRSQEQKDYTLKALKKLDLPQVSAESVLLLGPPKVERRALVAKDYRIVMLLGDTLHDFDARFRKTPVAEQRATAEAESAKWGTEWIVFPNSGYGTWSKEPLKGWDAKPVIEKW
ncbi:5'-nucleotidase (lipoprotein e(P4) family) [Pseudomonas sp. BIGb0408]|uniref:5'-nucleotidase (Lipoprotein e(P4) family) n=1 Tax=Phytopseudomonas flavescens TaxID=29435 RepID=A0A7Z0BRK6_9GAMM|nr:MULTISPECIES: HAD family acid phosphatase [Pseudomonas]MCW2291158.1 5'-nucleotidase (lipoprotein e(P4) family) [Pseudomonas sp. BIGb0408]NYH74271.1 5'-nucleotidase (lipoprotein e(P4) family) [Pseudomonas flavescens]